jgi:hypothetical protein
MLIHLKERLYARPLDPILAKLIQGKLTKLAKEHSGLTLKDIQDKDSDLFRFAYHYAVAHSQNHLLKMQNYVALYGFARTITMVMVLWFWIVPIVSFINRFPLLNSIVTTAILFILSFISFLNFMKFYRRFSLEVLMAISVMDLESKKPSKQKLLESP